MLILQVFLLILIFAEFSVVSVLRMLNKGSLVFGDPLFYGAFGKSYVIKYIIFCLKLCFVDERGFQTFSIKWTIMLIPAVAVC